MNANDIESTIDRALSALRDTAPRPGLEGRILSSLEHRTATRATNPGGLPFHSFIVKGWGIARGSARGNSARIAHIALWTATSAAILAAASITILHYRAMRTKNTVILSDAHRAESKNPETVGHAMNPEPFSTTNLAATTRTTPSRPGKDAVILSEAPQGRSRRSPVFTNAADAHTDGITPTDAQLLADLHAPSHPAPPLPLTPQERLFLHMLRYGSATQLAELDPIVRAQHDKADTAAFKAFFPDPPPLKQPGDPDDSN